MGGRIMAIKEENGWRPVLRVESIVPVHAQGEYPESTILRGEQLFFQTQRLGDQRFVDWVRFLQNFYEVPTVWGQLRCIRLESMEEWMQMMRQAYLPKIPVEPVQEANLKLLAAGYDKVKGYWLQFHGRLPLFQQRNWWQDHDE